VIIFSGFAADRMSSTALSLGADAYLEKGEALDVVRRTVREVAKERRRADGA
jgi:DNA-binding NarL/FixJ family response regulator